MQKPTAQKTTLHGAAAATQRQAGAAEDQPDPAATKPAATKSAKTGRMPARASSDPDSQTGSR